MEPLVPLDAALLVIDVQKGMDDPGRGRRNNPRAEANIARLIGWWRDNRRPVIHVRHATPEPGASFSPDMPGFEFKPEGTPMDDEPVFTKKVHSAFIGTRLEAHLRENGLCNLVIVGLTTDHCVSTSTRMAGNLGFNAYLVGDATATFDRKGPDGRLYAAEDIHAIHLASLDGEFCRVVTTDSLVPDTPRQGADADRSPVS